MLDHWLGRHLIWQSCGVWKNTKTCSYMPKFEINCVQKSALCIKIKIKLLNFTIIISLISDSYFLTRVHWKCKFYLLQPKVFRKFPMMPLFDSIESSGGWMHWSVINNTINFEISWNLNSRFRWMLEANWSKQKYEFSIWFPYIMQIWGILFVLMDFNLFNVFYFRGIAISRN